jgi:hypothetical protein
MSYASRKKRKSTVGGLLLEGYFKRFLREQRWEEIKKKGMRKVKNFKKVNDFTVRWRSVQARARYDRQTMCVLT